MASPDTKGQPDETAFTEEVETGMLGPRTVAMRTFLSERVIGQPQAIEAVVRRFQIHYAGLQDDVKPIAVMLFTGPTGVGKTLLVKDIARYLIEDTPIAPLTKVDCSKYYDRHEVAELTGSPAGYVRSEEPGLLAQTRIDAAHFWKKVSPLLGDYRGVTDDKTLEKMMVERYEQFAPYYSVILFDEIEKADRKLYDLLLGIIDDGLLPMNDGSVTLFRNSVIVMTSNIAGEDQQALAEGRGSIGFRGTRHEDGMPLDDAIIEKTMGGVKDTFKREFIGRLKDNIIVFRMLQRDSSAKILDLRLAAVQRKLDNDAEGGEPIRIHYAASFKDWLLGMAKVSLYGARDIDKLVENHVEYPLAAAKESEYLIEGDVAMFILDDAGRSVLKRQPRLPRQHGNFIPVDSGDDRRIVPVKAIKGPKRK